MCSLWWCTGARCCFRSLFPGPRVLVAKLQDTMLALACLCLVLAFIGRLQATDLTAYIHIGPHKTGSTHVQSFLSDHSDLFARSNVHWPEGFHTKRLATFARAIVSGDMERVKKETQVLEFIEKSRSMQRNVIISAEALDSLDADGVRLLQTILVGFQLRIIFGYRNPVSMMVSTHFELNKMPTEFSKSFASYMMNTLSTPARHLQVMTMLDAFTEVVGMTHMYIIDLAGASAQGLDITYVIVCEIARIYCDDTKVFAEKSARNAGSSLVHKQVFSYFKLYISLEKQKDCRICGDVSELYSRFDEWIETEGKTEDGFPLLHTTLHLLAPYAKEVDAALRAKYSVRILHGNVTANYEVIDHGIAVEELNVEEFIAKRVWRQWLERAYQWALKEGALCGCS